ncbi:MAG: comF family protein [Microgenomates group bacterium Gr01-1014_16]|nr:MAG: comF family protein [Microgenomates group bacterium Gr01-1014_16]
MNISDILDWIFPKKCVGCGKYGSYVCSDCEVGLWEEEQICPTCGRNSRNGLRHKYCKGDLEGLTCLWTYEGITRKLITKTKYNFYFDYLREFSIFNFQFSNNSQFFNFQKFLKTKPVVVPVPLHPKRLRERGFNQAEIIAKSFAARHSLACNSHLLSRIKETKPQVGRTREERLSAMSGAFTTSPLPLSLFKEREIRTPSAVILVDDVWTTGATMRECARVLKKAGVKQVWGFVLAR